MISVPSNFLFPKGLRSQKKGPSILGKMNMWDQNSFLKAIPNKANLSKLISVTLLPYFNTLSNKFLQPQCYPHRTDVPWGRCHVDKIKEVKKRTAEHTSSPREPEVLWVCRLRKEEQEMYILIPVPLSTTPSPSETNTCIH